MKRLAISLAQAFQTQSRTVLMLVVTFAIAIWCQNTFAQSGAGSIQGTVTDQTGAVLPNASIRVVNAATGVTANTASSEVGFYKIPGLFTGTYKVTITAPGMKSYVRNIELLVNQSANIDAVMVPGAVTQQVEVSADTVQLTTVDNGSISSTLENTRINQLPMNGRLLLNLAGMTTPGLETSGTRANGLFGEALEYVADGAPVINRGSGGIAQGGTTNSQLPDPDSVQEVRVETTNTSARYATPGTGTITTKSGSNLLHGTFFETARNNAIGIARMRQNPTAYTAPHLVRNEFGASAGGPIIIPKLYDGRQKSFWFFAYERYSQSQKSSQLVTVPMAAWRQGDFSGMTVNGKTQYLFDSSTTANSTACYNPDTKTTAANPYCRTQYTNNQIPIGQLAPATKLLYSITPAPTSADNPFVASNYNAVNPQFVVIPTVSIRLDHSLSERDKVYLRYGDTYRKSVALRNYPSNTAATIAGSGFPDGASGVVVAPTAQFTAAIGYTHIFSPTFYSETVLSQSWFAQHTLGGGNPTLNYGKMLGLPNNFGEVGFPYIGSTLAMPYLGTEWGYGNNQIIPNIDQNFDKTIGKHQIQFGGRIRYEGFGLQPNMSADTANFGSYTTALYDTNTKTNYAAASNTGNPNADFYVGAASSYSVAKQAPFYYYHDMEFDGYLQDNWHITRNLTINAGFRYEAHPAYFTKDGLEMGFDLEKKAIVLKNPTSFYVDKGYTTQAIITNMTNLGAVFETTAQAGYPDSIIGNSYLNILPRFGFAYQPFNGKHGTVIRGGYGRYIFPTSVGDSVKNGYANAPFTANYTQSYIAAYQAPDGLASYLIRTPQTVVMGKNSSNVVDTTSTSAISRGFSIGTNNPIYPLPVATQTNLTVEQPLKGNTALRASWIWTHGTDLNQQYVYNTGVSSYVWEMRTGTTAPSGTYSGVALNPYDHVTYGSNILNEKSGWSNYNALQLNYQRLYHHGIAYQISYVWAKPLRTGGYGYRDSNVYPYLDYVGSTSTIGTMTQAYGTVYPADQPPAPPAGAASYAYYKALNRFQNYKVDTSVPKQHITFNGVVDLPFGRGKQYLGSANRFIDEAVGGWQVAGSGNIFSQDFAVNATNWGLKNDITVTKHKRKITDCRSGVCHMAYSWFNGYIPPDVLNAAKNGVYGLPANYAPYQTPIDNTPGTQYYGKNYVQVNLANGSSIADIYSPGPSGVNPFSKTVLDGPINWTADLSLFKVFPIRNKTDLRFNMDAFNVFNVQGFNNPDTTTGIQSVQSSFNTGRQLQFTLRLTF